MHSPRGMHSPRVGPTDQPGSPLYPATFRNMTPYEDAYLDHDMAYPIPEPTPHDPFMDTANMLPENVPLSEQVSDNSPPLTDHATSVDGCNREDGNDTSPFAKLLPSTDILADKDDNEGSSAGNVVIMSDAVQRDIKEPERPLSAYALYFRDTHASIQLQNPNASFTEMSQMVASIWKELEPEHKLVYKRKAKVAKKEYRRAIAEHRSRLSMNSSSDQLDISRRSGYMSSPPGAMSVPPRGSMSLLQNSNPLLSSAMDGNSPRDYMDVASPEDVLTTQQQQQQRQQPPMALNSMFQKPKQTSVTPTHRCPQQMGINSLRPSAPCSASDRKPEMSASLGNQTSGCGTGVQNQQGEMPVITFTRCRRSGCTNPPVPSLEWDVEYCSSECVILHCKNVFSSWAAQRQTADRLPPQ
ncbi:TOX high mobility group box family member 4-B-like [Rhipicephalus microplus]|uniref:TOX high mobility group box family member 4-B-like n=1 Tax=Rhipicephalus microplus TaxID=6941 RepID=UPI003F6AA7E5